MFDETERHGALLQSFNDRRLTLSAHGPAPQNFFALLNDCFEGTLRRFPDLTQEVERVIPCPKPGCRGEFRESDLERFLAKKLESISCRGCGSIYLIPALLLGIHPSGTSAAINRLSGTGDEPAASGRDLLALVQRSFTETFHHEQSLSETHCPSVFTLEIDRLPGTPVSQIAHWWATVTGKAEPANLTLYCEQPGDWHPVKSYRIPPFAHRLVELAPHLGQLARLFKVASPVAKPAFDTMRALAEGARASSDEIAATGEPRWSQDDRALSLFTLRRLLEDVAPTERDSWGGLVKVLTRQFHYL